jgi:hypothetical protein
MIKYCCSLIILLLLATLSTCNKSVEPVAQEPADLFRIDLQDGFSNTPVKIFIDNSLLFADTVTTNYVISLAAIIPAQITKGMHILRTTVDNSITKDTTFTIVDTLYIGVNYNANSLSISYHFQHSPFFYR